MTRKPSEPGRRRAATRKPPLSTAKPLDEDQPMFTADGGPRRVALPPKRIRPRKEHMTTLTTAPVDRQDKPHDRGLCERDRNGFARTVCICPCPPCLAERCWEANA